MPNRSASKYKQKMTKLKGKMNNSRIMIGRFKIPLSATGRTSRQEVSKNILKSKQHICLNNIYRTLQPKVEYTFFSTARDMHTRTN